MWAWLSYLAVSVVWGSTFLGIAYAIETFTPLGLSAARFLPAGLLALAIGRLRKERRPEGLEILHLSIQGTLLLVVCMALIAWAEGRVASGVSATLGATVPLFLGMMEPRGLGAKGWAGLGLGFLGVVCLLWPSGQGPELKGAGALVLSALIWSAGTLYGKRHACRAGHFTQVGVEMLTAGLLSLAAAPFFGGFTHGPVTGSSLAALLYLILAGSIIAYTAYLHLSRVWPAARVGTYAYWNPVVALVLGGVLRHEPFRAGMMFGVGLILAGVALVQVPLPWKKWAGRLLSGKTSPGFEQ